MRDRTIRSRMIQGFGRDVKLFLESPLQCSRFESNVGCQGFHAEAMLLYDDPEFLVFENLWIHGI